MLKILLGRELHLYVPTATRELVALHRRNGDGGIVGCWLNQPPVGEGTSVSNFIFLKSVSVTDASKPYLLC